MTMRYPAELEQPGLLRDGRSVLIRPVRAADEEAMLDFTRRLSRRTLAQRLLGPVPRFRRELLRQFVDVDYTDHLALVAFLDDRMIGVGRLIRLEDTDHAEVTFTIADEFQGMGLGRLLLDRLAAAAPAIGVYVFEADVLTTNTAMLHVFATSGYAPSITPEGYLQHVVLRVDKRASALARISRREHRAARRSLEKLLAPRAVAVIGANRQPGTIGHEILLNVIAHGFPGPVYPVNPAAADIAGRPAVARVQDLPRQVDLAVIAVPPSALADVIRDCAEARVGAVVVVTADYPGEADTRHAAERDLTRFVRSHGMRMVGPTSMGLLSAHAGSVLHATFAPVRPPPGPVAMSSQSGPLGLAILDLAYRAGLGFSCFVSIGVAADVSSNDLLEWWEDDPETGVVLLYLESFGNPRNFGRIARRVGARKPVVAVTPGGATASGALLAQAGVIHTTSLEDMFDVALVLANQPVPPGSRVAIVTNAIDPARLTVVACAASGLTMAALSPPTLDRLLAAGIAPPLAARSPGVVDLRPTAAPGDYLTALSAVLADPEVDSAIVIFMPPLVRAVAEVAAAIKRAAGDAGGKPVVASFMSESGLPAPLRDDHGAIPSYVFPERAAAALGRAAAYGRWRREPVGALVYPPGIDQKAAGELVAAAEAGWLPAADAAALLGCYGIRVADAMPPADHGTGGTAAPRRDEEARRGVLRVYQDSLVGPVISFGLAGLFSDLFGDVATGVTPLTDRDASALLASLRAYPLLTGAAGGDPADLPAIEETMLRLSALAEDWPAVAEVTIDTLLIGGPGEGVTAVAPAVRIASVDDGGSDRLTRLAAGQEPQHQPAPRRPRLPPARHRVLRRGARLRVGRSARLRSPGRSRTFPCDVDRDLPGGHDLAGCGADGLRLGEMHAAPAPRAASDRPQVLAGRDGQVLDGHRDRGEAAALGEVVAGQHRARGRGVEQGRDHPAMEDAGVRAELLRIRQEHLDGLGVPLQDLKGAVLVKRHALGPVLAEPLPPSFLLARRQSVVSQPSSVSYTVPVGLSRSYSMIQVTY